MPRPPEERTGRSAPQRLGPRRLAAADELNGRPSVTVYEKDEAVGGLLRFGVPAQSWRSG